MNLQGSINSKSSVKMKLYAWQLLQMELSFKSEKLFNQKVCLYSWKCVSVDMFATIFLSNMILNYSLERVEVFNITSAALRSAPKR